MWSISSLHFHVIAVSHVSLPFTLVTLLKCVITAFFTVCSNMLVALSETRRVPLSHGHRQFLFSPDGWSQQDVAVVLEIVDRAASQHDVCQDVTTKAVEHGAQPGGHWAPAGNLHRACNTEEAHTVSTDTHGKSPNCGQQRWRVYLQTREESEVFL